MTAITEEEYTKNVLARCSNEFHGDVVCPAAMIHVISEFGTASANMDVLKKALFYGKVTEDIGLEQFLASMKEFSDPWPAGMTDKDYDLIHAVMGICSEIHEMLGALGTRMQQLRFADPMIDGGDDVVFDRVNMLEELGDIMWYLTLGINACGSTLADERQRNDNKLEKRYGGVVFSEDKANNRDLDAEREALEREWERKDEGR